MKIGTSGFSKHGPFDLEYTDSGYVLISYKGIFIGGGRPWIKELGQIGYSALLQKIWEEKENPPRCCASECEQVRSELSNYCPEHQRCLYR